MVVEAYIIFSIEGKKFVVSNIIINICFFLFYNQNNNCIFNTSEQWFKIKVYISLKKIKNHNHPWRKNSFTNIKMIIYEIKNQRYNEEQDPVRSIFMVWALKLGVWPTYHLLATNQDW